MKKSIFAVVVLSTAVLFSACKPDDKKDAVTGITVNPSELTIYPGDEARLSITVTPEKATYNADELVWASSDTTVVVVSQNGTITALKEGTANITVTYKDLKSACAVTVSSWIKNLFFTGCYFGIADTAAYGEIIDTIQSISGDPYYVKTVQAYVMLFTQGFYLNKEGEFAGASTGGLVESLAPMYYAPGWLNKSDHGTYFCLGEWYVYDTLYAQCMPTGKVNDAYLSNMKLFLDNIMAGDQTTAYTINMKNAGADGCEGTTMTVYDYHTTAEGYGEDGYYSSYIPDLFFTRGYLYADDNYIGSDLLCSVEGHHLVAKELLNTDEDANNNFYAYGCHWHYDEASQGYSWVDEVIKFDEEITYDRNLDIFDGAPARRGNLKVCRELKNVHDMETTKRIVEKIHNTPRDHKRVK